MKTTELIEDHDVTRVEVFEPLFDLHEALPTYFFLKDGNTIQIERIVPDSPYDVIKSGDSFIEIKH